MPQNMKTFYALVIIILKHVVLSYKFISWSQTYKYDCTHLGVTRVSKTNHRGL